MISRRRFLHGVAGTIAWLGLPGRAMPSGLFQDPLKSPDRILYPIHVGGEGGYIDRNGNVVVPPRYDFVHGFSEGMGLVEAGDKFGYVDGDGTEAIPVVYDDAGYFCCGLAVVQTNGKRGYIDRSGKMVIPPIYDQAGIFSEDLAGVAVNGCGRFIDKDGRFAFTRKFKVEDQAGGSPFQEGLAAISVGGLYGFINRSGEFVIPPKYRYASGFFHGLACVGDQGDRHYIDRNGRSVFGDMSFEYADFMFNEGLSVVQLKGSEYYGFIDLEGRLAIPAKFANAESFSEGLAAVDQEDGSVGMGYIDRNGDFVIPPRWKWAFGFKDGIAPVQQADNAWGYIDRVGNYIWKP